MSPMVSTAGLKFGIISVVKDKIEELKQKKKEKEEKEEKEKVNAYESTTDSNGEATFKLSSGETKQIKIVDEASADPLPSIKVFLFTNEDESIGLYFIGDPSGVYAPTIVSPSSSGTQGETIRIKIIPGLYDKAMSWWAKIKGDEPAPLGEAVLPLGLTEEIVGMCFSYVRTTTVGKLATVLAAGEVGDIVIGWLLTPVKGIGLVYKAVDHSLFSYEYQMIANHSFWTAYWLVQGYSLTDEVDIYELKKGAERALDKLFQAIGTKLNVSVSLRIVVMQKEKPEPVQTCSISGTVTDAYSSNPVEGVNQTIYPNEMTTTSDVNGYYIFRDVPLYSSSTGYFKIRAEKLGYYFNSINVDVTTLSYAVENTGYNLQLTPYNPPNTPSTPTGPSTGSTGTSYTFSTSATDPDGDQVQYRFDWGDGNISGYTSLVNSGSSASKSHSYSGANTYYIKAQARDSNGAISGWSGGHQIAINGAVAGMYPVWAPDSSKIAYVTDSNGDGTNEIWVMNADGTGKTQLTSNGNHPDWVGDWILFTKEGNEPNVGNNELWKIKSDGTGLMQVTFTYSNGIDQHIWGDDGCGTVSFGKLSPDGTKVAFHAHHGNGWFDPYVCNADGTDGYVLLQNLSHTDDNTWSPDSVKVLYAAGSDYYLSHTLYTSNSDGLNDTTIASSLPPQSEYCYSPDGTKIIYISGTLSKPSKHEPYDTVDLNLSIMNADGSGQTDLLNDAYNECFGRKLDTSTGGFLYYRFQDKVWSPDSQKIVFASDRSGNSDIYVINKDGSNLTRLTTDSSIELDATWSPDGTKIAYVSGKTGSWDIYVMGCGVNNPPNTPSTPTGPSTGSTGTSYTFSTTATDPDGDQVQYRFDWDDGNISGYTSLVNSGSSASKSHSYSSANTYYIKAQARDSNGATSGWSGSHSITITGGGGGEGTKKWEFPTGGHVGSSPAIGSDGTIYVGCRDDNLYAINPNGTKKWQFPIVIGADRISSPAIGSDGTIYVGSHNSTLYAIYADGTNKWEFPTGGRVESSPAIGSDGTIYVGSISYDLYAINPNGTEKWRFPTGAYIESSPAIGSDGTIYVGSDDNNLYAINPNGTEKWRFPTGDWVRSSPAIGSDGTIYVGSRDNKLYAINPNGTEKWRFPTGAYIESSPAIGSDGTIYIGSDDNNLYAINPNGTEKWRFPTGDLVRSSPAIGSDGTIYVGSWNGKLYAINPDGTKMWAFETGSYIMDSSPTIGSDGTIYVGTYDDIYEGKLFAIYASGNLANTPWPMFHHDVKHTGRQ